MEKENSKLLLISAGIVFAVIFGFAFTLYQGIGTAQDPYATDPISSFIKKINIPSVVEILAPEPKEPAAGPANLDDVAKFATEQEFKDYLEESQAISGAYYGELSMGGTARDMTSSGEAEVMFSAPTAEKALPREP